MSLGSLLEDTVAVLIERLAAMEYYPTPIIDLGVLVAQSDGSIEPEELALLRELFGDLLGTKLRGKLAQHLIDASLEVTKMAGADARIRVLAEILVDCEAVEEGLIVAASLANTANGIGAGERTLLESLAKSCSAPPGTLARVIERVEKAPVPLPASSRLSLAALPIAEDSNASALSAADSERSL